MRALGLGTLVLAAACSQPSTDAPPNESPARDGIRLVDVSAATGIDSPQIGGGESVDYIIDSIGTGAAWLDYDGDGDADLFLAQGATSLSPRNGPRDELWRNDGDSDGDGVPEFTEVGASARLGDTQWSFGVAVADYDADGDPDIYLTNWGRNRLYRNEGDGTFVDVAAEAGVADDRWGTSAAWGDPDGDGDLDLYVGNYVEFDYGLYPARGERPAGGGSPCVWKSVEVYCGPRNLIAQHDAFYRNRGDGTFEEVAADVGLLTPDPFFTLAVRWVDLDDDGDDDLYVANDSVPNSYFVNQGDGTFFEEAIFSGLAYNEQGHEQAGMGIAVGDYDLDGRFDLAVSNFSHDHDTLYHNDGDGVFSDRSYPSGIGTPSYLALAWGLVFVDLDQDGLEDLFVARGHVYPQIDGKRLGTSFRQPNGVYRNAGDGAFVELGGMTDVESSRAVLPGDLDGDGDVDLLVTNLNAPPTLLRNDSSGGHWLRVRLAQPGANREALGARVRIGRQMREIRREAPFLGSVLPEAHFGLGASSETVAVSVRWPGGETERFVDLPVDRSIELKRGSGAPPDGGQGP